MSQELLALGWDLVRFRLNNSLLFNWFCRLNDDLWLHIHLSVFILHHHHTWLSGRLWDLYLRQSRLIHRLWCRVISGIRSSAKPRVWRWVQCADKVLYIVGKVWYFTQKRGELEFLWRLSYGHVESWQLFVLLLFVLLFAWFFLIIFILVPWPRTRPWPWLVLIILIPVLSAFVFVLIVLVIFLLLTVLFVVFFLFRVDVWFFLVGHGWLVSISKRLCITKIYILYLSIKLW